MEIGRKPSGWDGAVEREGGNASERRRDDARTRTKRTRKAEAKRPDRALYANDSLRPPSNPSRLVHREARMAPRGARYAARSHWREDET